MEKLEARIIVLEQLVGELILKLGRANHRIYMITQQIDTIEKEHPRIPRSHSNSKVVSL